MFAQKFLFSQAEGANLDRASPQIRSLARRIIAFETVERASAGIPAPAKFPTVAKLSVCLSALMGQIGCQALLSRALVLAAGEFRWLAQLSVNSSCAVEALTVPQAALEPADFAEGEVAMVSQLLALLVAFIGPTLTLRLLKELWPTLSLGHGDLYNPENQEDAK